MARNNNDIFWKGILEDLFADFLRFLYPDADELFDFSKAFDFLDQELEKLFPVGDPLHPKFVDKLVKVFTKDGNEQWILIHVEVQGYKDVGFAERMFTYFYRIRDTYGKRVRSIAILTDNNKNYHPKEYTYMEDDTTIIFRYKTLKVIDQDPVALEQSNNPFAVVILTVQLALRKNRLDPGDYLALTLDLVRRMYRKGFEREKIRHLLNFIRKYVNFEKPEIISKFDGELDKLDNKIRTMGIREQILQVEREEGIQIGKEQEKLQLVKNLLLKTNHSLQEIADLTEVSVYFVMKVKKQLKSK